MTSEPVPVLGSTPTPELRCRMALNMLQQMEPCERTISLAIAALQGKPLGTIIAEALK
jgi:hypothetical protein